MDRNGHNGLQPNFIYEETQAIQSLMLSWLPRKMPGESRSVAAKLQCPRSFSDQNGPGLHGIPDNGLAGRCTRMWHPVQNRDSLCIFRMLTVNISAIWILPWTGFPDSCSWCLHLLAMHPDHPLWSGYIKSRQNLQTQVKTDVIGPKKKSFLSALDKHDMILRQNGATLGSKGNAKIQYLLHSLSSLLARESMLLESTNILWKPPRAEVECVSLDRQINRHITKQESLLFFAGKRWEGSSQKIPIMRKNQARFRKHRQSDRIMIELWACLKASNESGNPRI